MSQHPIYAAPAEHASKISGITPSNTSQGGSMEPNMEVPNFSDGNKGSHFPFMKLPVGKYTVAYTVREDPELTFILTSLEIRLEVYPYLLIAAPSWSKDAERTRHLSKGVVLDIYQPQRGKIGCRRFNGGVKAHASTGLTPQILCTCKTINQEATAILYGQNTFQFRLSCVSPPWDYDPTKKEVRRYLDEQVHPKVLYCKDGKADSAPFGCSLAMFLRRIGQLNAASLKKLRFVREEKTWQYADVHEAGWAIALFARLLKCLTPAVSQIKVCLTSIVWDDFEIGPFELVEDETEHHTDSDDEDDGRLDYPLSEWDPIFRGKQEALYTAIKYLAEQLFSLKQLRVTGVHQGDADYQRIQKLQTWVKIQR